MPILQEDSQVQQPRGTWGLGVAGEPKRTSVWPDPRQELLLRAGLLEGEAALRAWGAWRAQAREPFDPQSLEILPLVYRNLRDAGVGDLAPLRPLYLRTWAHNQKLFRVLSRTLPQLHAAGLETLVFKGAALIPLYYRDEGMRGMGDFDVLVRENRLHDAARVLSETGWSALSGYPRHFDTRFCHAIPFTDQDGNNVDLHCHVVMANCEFGADEPFWRSSVPARIHGIETRTLCATDHLLHACVHGMNWVKGVPSLRWVADAILIARVSPGGIDWNRMEWLSRERGVTPHVVEPLAYLEERFGLDIPKGYVERLRAGVTRAELRSFRIEAESQRGRPVSLLRYHWSRYSRGLGEVGLSERFASVPQYLRYWFQTDRLWKVAPRLIAKGIRIVGHRLGLYRYWDA